MKKTIAPDLEIKVISPFEVIYNGKAQSISAKNKVGDFDILPDHANYITLLTKCEVVIQSEIDQRRYKLDKGVLKVENNKVVVFVNI